MVDVKEDVIRTEDLSMVYKEGEIEVHALKQINLTIQLGEFTALAGPSGSGKTTFLNLISGLDHPASGRVLLSGKAMSDMSGNELSDFRRDHIEK